MMLPTKNRLIMSSEGKKVNGIVGLKDKGLLISLRTESLVEQLVPLLTWYKRWRCKKSWNLKIPS